MAQFGSPDRPATLILSGALGQKGIWSTFNTAVIKGTEVQAGGFVESTDPRASGQSRLVCFLETVSGKTRRSFALCRQGGVFVVANLFERGNHRCLVSPLQDNPISCTDEMPAEEAVKKYLEALRLRQLRRDEVDPDARREKDRARKRAKAERQLLAENSKVTTTSATTTSATASTAAGPSSSLEVLAAASRIVREPANPSSSILPSSPLSNLPDEFPLSPPRPPLSPPPSMSSQPPSMSPQQQQELGQEPVHAGQPQAPSVIDQWRTVLHGLMQELVQQQQQQQVQQVQQQQQQRQQPVQTEQETEQEAEQEGEPLKSNLLTTLTGKGYYLAKRVMDFNPELEEALRRVETPNSIFNEYGKNGHMKKRPRSNTLSTLSHNPLTLNFFVCVL